MKCTISLGILNNFHPNQTVRIFILRPTNIVALRLNKNEKKGGLQGNTIVCRFAARDVKPPVVNNEQQRKHESTE